MGRGRSTVFVLGTLLFGTGADAQESVEDRLDRIEAENAELRLRIEALAQEQEDLSLGSVVPTMGDSIFGLGPAASKIYSKDQGVSIGGYGELVLRDFAGDTPREFDFVRSVIYLGYRFNEDWVFNSEIEFEHASTGEEGSVSVEFAYVDRLISDEVNARVGLLLAPMGFLNELHEPPTYLAATRPETERRIIPSTWRENGAGVFGDVGPVSYRAYVMNGLDATGFDAGGLRGGRQKGSEALAEDLAVVVRADWTDTPGLIAGGSVYHGGSGQGQAGLGETDTTIVELHAEWKARGLWLRGLTAYAKLDDVDQLNASEGLVGTDSVGEEMAGTYVEAGYDIMGFFDPDSEESLSPYFRYERIDTQAEVPPGFASTGATDFDIFTVGLNYRPTAGLVFKLDFQDYESGPDRVNFSMGYAF